MTRIEKKWADHWRDFETIIAWHHDHRAYLMEALDDGTPLRVIQRQFKRRFTTRGARNRYFRRTRMVEYFNMVVDNPAIRL